MPDIYPEVLYDNADGVAVTLSGRATEDLWEVNGRSGAEVPELETVAPLGAKAFSKDFQKCEYYPQGTAFTFTGKTQERNGYTYCECKPIVSALWIAVNDGDTQILRNKGGSGSR